MVRLASLGEAEVRQYRYDRGPEMVRFPSRVVRGSVMAEGFPRPRSKRIRTSRLLSTRPPRTEANAWPARSFTDASFLLVLHVACLS